MLRTTSTHENSQPQTPSKGTDTRARLKGRESLIPRRHQVFALRPKFEKEGHHQARSVLQDLPRFFFTYCFLSHHIPLLICHGPSTCRGEHSCRDNRPLGCVAQLPALMHFLAQHVQGHAASQGHLCQLPILHEKRDLACRPI